jgi:two-component system sensor histidine kinase AlgZ
MVNSASTTETGGFFIPDLCATRSVLIMFILAELMVVLYVLGDSELPSFPWADFALASLFVQWIVLLSAASLCSARVVLAGLSLPAGVAISFLIIALVTLLSSIVALLVFEDSAYADIDNWWLLRNLLVAAVVGGITLRYFYLQQQLRAREQAEMNARIESLRARIRPHFLFNTMNSIASLIGSRPREAEQVVEDLSELFRASLIESEHSATLAAELHLCRIYLRIEQLRLGDRLQIDWDVDEDLLGSDMPSLLLQPLIENAVYHGVARLPDGGTIAISVQRQGVAMLIRISNPLPQSAEPVPGGHQMALDNIRQRLSVHYGDSAYLELSEEAEIYSVELLIPTELEA